MTYLFDETDTEQKLTARLKEAAAAFSLIADILEGAYVGFEPAEERVSDIARRWQRRCEEEVRRSSKP